MQLKVEQQTENQLANFSLISMEWREYPKKLFKLTLSYCLLKQMIILMKSWKVFGITGMLTNKVILKLKESLLFLDLWLEM